MSLQPIPIPRVEPSVLGQSSVRSRKPLRLRCMPTLSRATSLSIVDEQSDQGSDESDW